DPGGLLIIDYTYLYSAFGTNSVQIPFLISLFLIHGFICTLSLKLYHTLQKIKKSHPPARKEDVTFVLEIT
ncbi:hypothetical protein, partial [Lactovum odontotermitis]